MPRRGEQNEPPVMPPSSSLISFGRSRLTGGVAVSTWTPPDGPIAGTIFASTHLPLRLWFRAIYHLTQTKQGISSIELGRRLGVTQTTVWKIKHKLKQVMLERDARKRLTGRIEIDDAYLGGERSGGSAGGTWCTGRDHGSSPDYTVCRRMPGIQSHAASVTQ